MKKLFLSSVALVALAVGPALAADMPRKAYGPPPPPPPPMLSWTGFYIGLNAGATWQCGDATNTLTVGPHDADWPHGGAAESPAHLAAVAAAGTGSTNNGCNDANFIGGGQIGYNWQFTNWVVGIEADIQGIAGNNNGNGNGFVNVAPVVGFPGEGNWIGAFGVDRDQNWLGTARLRAGWLATPAWLIYATGGLAYGRTEATVAGTLFNDVYANIGAPHIPPVSGFGSASDTRFGWTVGGGFEWMFAPQWSLKAEYLYYDLGSLDTDYAVLIHDNASGLNATFNGHTEVDFKGHIARVGVNWHFNP